MKSLRLVWRASRLAAGTASWYALLRLSSWTAGFGSGAELRRMRRRRFVMRHWARAVCRALAVDVEVLGDPPAEPCLLVSNHLGYLDIPVLASVFDTLFVSKSEVASWPVVGHLATSAGTLYVERQNKRSLPAVNRDIRAALERGDGVVVFPEGTSTGGDGVLPFRPSLLAPAVELGLSVRCASLVYGTQAGDPPAAEAVCWWRDMPFGPHVLGLMRLARVRARVVFAPGSVSAQDRKELAQKLWEVVQAGITPLA